jgi:transposase
MRSNGTAKELEARRRLAVQRVEDGWTRREVAAFLGVHPVTVAKWMARFRDRGEDGLAAKPTPGRPRLLTAAQETEVLGWLADPPTKHGFRTDLWTARRVAELIRTRLKVGFHPHYIREWLRKRGYSPQKPARRAKQQDPAEVARWLRDEWPRIEKKSPRATPTSS